MSYLMQGLVLLLALPLYACDICGCSSSTTYVGVLPLIAQHLIGVRHTYRAFESQHPPLLSTSPLGSINQERFHTLEVWGRVQVRPKWQVSFILPYNSYEQNEDGILRSNKGLGDASLLINYTLLNTAQRLMLPKWTQSLQVGIGVKLPTGSYQKSQNETLLNPNLQMGTGSTALLSTLIYTLKYEDWVLEQGASYKYTTTNPNGYRFGSNWNVSTRLLYTLQLGALKCIPNVGWNGDVLEQDQKDRKAQDYTGGYSIYASGGVDLFYKKMVLGSKIQSPLYQNLGEGYIHNKAYLQTYFIYLF